MPLKQKTVKVFETTDGKTFTEESTARTHQATLDHGNMLDQYEAENPGMFAVQGASSHMRNRVMPFVAWIESKGAKLPNFEPVKKAPSENEKAAAENADTGTAAENEKKAA
jgi:hypothetical protein